MKNLISLVLTLLLSFSVFAATTKSKALAKDEIVKVLLETDMGNIHIDLNKTKAPLTVKNFLSYVDKKYYDGLIFHRIIKKFMIQGGGFTKDMKKKSTSDPIKNEANNGLLNETGTIAMARTSNPNSATSQFFINVVDNHFLNYQSPSKMGYAVFGHVTKGMPILKKMEMVPTSVKNGMRDVPTSPVTIKTIKRL